MTEPRQQPGRSRQDYGTPPELLEAVKERFRIEQFDCDLAASKANAVCPHYLSVMDDALSGITWKRGTGYNWLNPPFASIEGWVSKAWMQLCACEAKTLVLIPAAVGSNWWRDWVHNKARVRFLNPRLTFVGCKDPYPKDCALLVYEDADSVDDYDVWTWKQGKAMDARFTPVDQGKAIGSAEKEQRFGDGGRG